MSYRLLYVLAGLCFAQSAACITAIIWVLTIEGNPLVPIIFTVAGILCGLSFLGLAKRQRLLYGTSTDATLPTPIQFALDKGVLTQEEYDEVVAIGEKYS